MTVDITQEEMNILNLNGITVEDVQNNINLMRASGFDDDSIRQQYNDTINAFKPVTKTAVTDTKNIEKWNKQGGITPYEFAKKAAKTIWDIETGAFAKKFYEENWKPKEKGNVSDREIEWNGTYDNVIDTKEEQYNKVKADYENRAKKQIQERKERDKRVNEGTASFFDRVGAWADRATNNPYPAETYEEFQKNWENENQSNNKLNYNPDNKQNLSYVTKGGQLVYKDTKEPDMNKKIGFYERVLDKWATLGWVPFIGGFFEEFDDKEQRKIQNKIIKDEPITDLELNFLNRKIEKMKEEKVRGFTWGGAIADSYLNSLIRFGTEMMVGGAVAEGLGIVSKAPEGASAMQKIGVGLGNAGKFGLLNTLLPTTYNDTYETYQQRRMNDSFRLTEDGKVYFREAEEKPATSFLKSMLTTFLMFSTEATGEVMSEAVKGIAGAGSKYIGSPLIAALMKNKQLNKFAQNTMPALSKAYEKLNNLPIKGKSLDWLKSKVKYDGFLEEIGEEVLEDILNVTLEIDKERTLENYAKAIFKSPDEWAVLVGTIALQGGTLSIASHMLGKYMIDNGASEEETVQTLQKLGEEGAVEQLSKLVEEGEIDVDDYNSYEKRRERAVESVAESFKNINKEKDYSKNAADILVRMAEHVSELNQNFDMEEILEREKPEVRNENNEILKQVQNDDINIIDNRIDEIYREVDSLTEDDKEYSDKLMAEADLLEKIRNNELDESEYEAAQNVMNQLKSVVYNQSAQYAGADENEIEEAAKEWEEKGTDSKYFKRWFGDSKVVVGKNIPAIAYHNTNNEFDTFSRKYEGQANGRPVYSGGFNFTTDKNYAKQFGGKQMAVYLSIKNPLNEETYSPEKFIEPVYKLFYGEDYKDYMEGSDNWTGYIEGKLSSLYGLRDLMQGLRYKKGVDVVELYKSLGYDGEQDGHIWVAFSPEQIKSVDNRGTFDANNPNIYFQRKKYDNPDQLKFDFDSLVQRQAEQQKQIFQPESVSGQNVQQEIKKEYKEADIKQKKIDNANNGDIVDTGDSLLGNLKKNKKQYTWEELESMNELLRKKYLSKSYIYQLPSAEELRKEGLSDRTIAYVYLVHSKINAKPSKYYDDKLEYQKIYFDGVHEVMGKTIDFAKKNNDLIANYNKNSGRNKELFDSIFPDYENKKPYNVFTAYPDLNKKALIIGGNKLVDVFQLGYSTENDITKALALVDKEKTQTQTQKSDLKGWETKFSVAESYRGWFVADKKSGMIITERDLPSEAIAKEVAQKIYDYIKEQEFSFTANYETLRDYIPRRENNQNVRPEALIEVFGFRGINFGNWTKQSERQDFINLAYDSLYDLAELLKLPPRALSLDGKLGLAFGAQGRSGSAGHFIPEYNEINLTRKYGAGSLAHEWWHALDYYFGDFALGKDFSGESALGSVKQGVLRTEIFDALKNLMEQIKYAPLSEEEVEKRAKAIEEGAKRNIEYHAKDIKNSFAKSKNADKIAALIDDIVKNADKIDISSTEARVEYDTKFTSMLEEKRKTWTNIGKMSSLIYACKKLQSVKEIAAAQKSYSKFYNDARELNKYEKGHGADYWTRNTELGARAFASYILDKTAKQNFKNNFLVRDEKGEMSYNLESIGRKLASLQKGEKLKIDESDMLFYYPSDSRERERIFAAFDNLFNNIKYQKTDRGYRLYQAKISPKTSQKAREVLNALQKIANGSEEETVSNLRDDLEQYGGTNDVTFVFGNNKKGIQHIAQKHGAKTLLKVFDTVIDGKIKRYVTGNKTVIIGKGNYEAVLSLDEHGKKKTWLLSGWDITKQTKKSSDVSGEVSTQSDTTQIKPTFSRQDLGAELSNIITDNSENFKGGKGELYQDNDDNDVNEEWEKLVNDSSQESLFFNKSKSDNFIDTLEKRDKRGAYIPVEKVIELYKNSDESTFLHEMAHWYLDLLTEYAEGSEELTAELNEVRKWLKNDGGEWTVAQHEKFARGFEAYIRSGYAKSNKLKKVFEYFKNFLLDIYESLKQLDIKEEEMPQIISLFDRLLSTEKERIQSTVFDKISEIDEQINKIKENEVKEFEYLDSIWEESQQKAINNEKVQEYLRLADKVTARETKEVREFKQRYKNATFEILEAATGKPRTWIANQKNWEKLQELLGDVDDKITVNVGFSPNWAEFYYDSGVSYENDDTDGDYNLAQQAFDVMTEGSYNRTFEEDYRYDDINKYLEKFDYLAAKVKSEKYENKQAALSALEYFYNHFENMPSMPEEIMKSVGERIMKVQEDTYDSIKENYNRKSTLSGAIQLQAYITQKLDDLKVYNPETRYKMRLNKSHRLYKFIKNVRSVNSAKRELRRINDFIIDDMRNNQRSLLHKEIQKQLKVNSKVVKVGNMKRGKFDWRTNTIFAELVNLNRLSRKDAEVQLGALLDIQNAAKGEERDSFDENPTAEFNKTNNFEDKIKNEFLQYRSMKLQDLDVTHTIILLNDLLELKEKGRQAKTKEDFENKVKKWSTKNNLLDLLEVTKLSGKFGANWIAGVGKLGFVTEGVLANWESTLNALFNKDTAEKYSLLLDEANSEVYAREHIQDFYNRANQIYKFRSPNAWDKFLDYDYMQPLIKLMQEYNRETRTFRQRVFSINNPNGYAESDIELSRAQAITMYAWGLNEKLEQRLMTQFGLDQIRDIFENWLSEEDRKLAWALVDTCEGMREDINEVFINTTGLSLPKVENYFPSKAERVQSDIDLYHDFFVKSSNPSFIKDRKVCNRIPMRPMSPLEILIPHISKTAKYVVMSEKVNFLNQVFKDTAIKTKMQEIWGSENGAKIYQVMINKLASCTYTNYSKGSNLIKDWANEIGKNYVVANIGGNTKVMFGQLLSMINYAENMPSGEWAAGFVKAWANPVKTFKYMMDNCPYLQTRLAGNTQNEVMAILTSEKDRFRTLKNFMTANTKWGDIIAIIYGGKPYVDYLIEKQGMTKEVAFNKFVEDTLRAQQAGTTSSISEWQSEMARNTWTKLFFAFRNTSIQYERKFVDTLIQAKRGDISKGQAIKKILIYKVLNPILFTSMLGNLSLVAFIRALFDGDDDAILNLIKEFAQSIALSGNDGYGMAFVIINAVEESLLAHFDSDYKDFDTSTPIVTDVQKEVRKILKGDLTLAEYVEAIADISGELVGIPANRIINAAEGIGDITQGNIGVGLSRLGGWGKYTSTKAWTGDAPEKKKKKTSGRTRARSINRRRR